VIPLLALLLIAAPAQGGPVFHVRPGSTAPFSPAVRAGDLVFLSGQIGARSDGTIPTDMAEAGTLAMDQVRASATLAGLTMDDIVKCTVFLADMKQWPAFNSVYVRYFTAGRLPARSALGTNGLALSASVEVECIGYKPVTSRK
jgi:2-iminobutanoate/2-iminopropanoate deaminase